MDVKWGLAEMSKLPVIAEHTLEKFSLASERQGGSDIRDSKQIYFNKISLGYKILSVR